MKQILVSEELLRQALKAFEVATTPLAADRQEVLKAIAALRNALEQPAREPVAWIYQNANTDNEYLVWKKGTGGRNWRPLFTAPVQESAVEVNYRDMYLKVRDELAEAQQRLGTCEALARSVMNDQVGRA